MLVLDVSLDSNAVKAGIDLSMKNDRIFHIFSSVLSIWRIDMKTLQISYQKVIKYELKIGFKHVIKFIRDGIWHLSITRCLFKNIHNSLGKNHKIINHRVYLNISFCLWNVQ